MTWKQNWLLVKVCCASSVALLFGLSTAGLFVKTVLRIWMPMGDPQVAMIGHFLAPWIMGLVLGVMAAISIAFGLYARRQVTALKGAEIVPMKR